MLITVYLIKEASSVSNDLWSALVALLIGGVLGGIIQGYFNYKSKVWEKIWDKRLEAYMKFVAMTALFPKYPRNNVNWKDVYQLSTNFRNWYFEGNGLIISSEFRNQYFHLQEHILEVTKERARSEDKLSDHEYDDLQKRCSALRSLMAKELESRESPFWRRSTKRVIA